MASPAGRVQPAGATAGRGCHPRSCRSGPPSWRAPQSSASAVWPPWPIPGLFPPRCSGSPMSSSPHLPRAPGQPPSHHRQRRAPARPPPTGPARCQPRTTPANPASVPRHTVRVCPAHIPRHTVRASPAGIPPQAVRAGQAAPRLSTGRASRAGFPRRTAPAPRRYIPCPARHSQRHITSHSQKSPSGPCNTRPAASVPVTASFPTPPAFCHDSSVQKLAGRAPPPGQ